MTQCQHSSNWSFGTQVWVLPEGWDVAIKIPHSDTPLIFKEKFSPSQFPVLTTVVASREESLDCNIGLNTEPCHVTKNGCYLQTHLRLTTIKHAFPFPKLVNRLYFTTYAFGDLYIRFFKKRHCQAKHQKHFVFITCTLFYLKNTKSLASPIHPIPYNYQDLHQGFVPPKSSTARLG